MSNENELKPCPFCGKEPRIRQMEGLWYVQCANNRCAVHPEANAKEKPVAIAVWDTRRAESGELTRLRADLDAANKRAEWVNTAESLPLSDNDDYYGEDYSIPVVVVIAGVVQYAMYRYCYASRGWVAADLRDGPSPDDYERPNVTHWLCIQIPEAPTPPAAVENDTMADVAPATGTRWFINNNGVACRLHGLILEERNSDGTWWFSHTSATWFRENYARHNFRELTHAEAIAAGIENGAMIRYAIRNGTEGEMFFSQCDGCKHDCRAEGTLDVCRVGIGSRIMRQKSGEDDANTLFVANDELDITTCLLGPARCMKREAK